MNYSYDVYNPVPKEYLDKQTLPMSYIVPYEIVRSKQNKSLYSIRRLGDNLNKDILVNPPLSRQELHKEIISGSHDFCKYWSSLLHRLYPTNEFDLRARL